MSHAGRRRAGICRTAGIEALVAGAASADAALLDLATAADANSLSLAGDQAAGIGASEAAVTDLASTGPTAQSPQSWDHFAAIVAPHPLTAERATVLFHSMVAGLPSGPVPTAAVTTGGASSIEGAEVGVQAFTAEGGNSPPDAVDDEVGTDEDTAINLYHLTYNDTDADLDTLTVIGVSQAAHASVVLESDGTVTYSPDADWHGSDAFTYTISDGIETDTAVVSVTVNPVNDLPAADAVEAGTNEDTPVAVTLSGTDVETAELTFFIDTAPAEGTLGELSGDSVTYFPGGNFSGVDSFTYQAYDGERLSEPATVTVTVSEVADNPGVTLTATGGTNAVSEPGFLEGEEARSDTYTVVLNTAPSANVVIAIQPDSQLQALPTELTFTPEDWSIAQTVTLDPVADEVAEGDHTGIVTHTAASADPVYNNISIANVTVSVTDFDFAWIGASPPDPLVDLNEEGPTSADYLIRLTSKPTANVTVTLTPDSQVTASVGSMTFTPTDWDVEQSVTITAVDDAVADGYHAGVVTLTASSADANYSGLATDFSVSILDNDGPNALPDEVSTDEDTAVNFAPTLNDLDPAGHPLYVTQVTQPGHGSAILEQDGTVTYTPEADWYGIDEFSYTMACDYGGTDAGAVTVAVMAVNDPPDVTDPGAQAFAEDDFVSLQIMASDLEESAFLYTAPDDYMPGGGVGLPPGLVLDSMAGRIWGWIDPRASGAYTTYITVDDLNGGTTTISFDWTITDTNHSPFLQHMGYCYSVQGGWTVAAGPYTNDIDEDPVSVTMTNLPPGLAYDPGSNMITGVPTTAGVYEVSVVADDGQGGTDSDAFLWYVLPPGVNGPFAIAGFGPMAEWWGITLADPPSPLVGSVYLINPDNPNADVDVTLSISPAGRATVSPSTFILRDGGSAQFQVTPTAVSQAVQDTFLFASVGANKTSRASLTNVGIVLPQHIRGPDTPKGMKDRISVGAQNWGTYNGVVTVVPNLKGQHAVGLEVIRPENDPKYGSAGVAAAQVERLSVATKVATTVCGAEQTEPSYDANGEPDGANAGHLRLLAEVTCAGGTAQLAMANGFAVANIPTTITFTEAEPLTARWESSPTSKGAWDWGVKYPLGATALRWRGLGGRGVGNGD